MKQLKRGLQWLLPVLIAMSVSGSRAAGPIVLDMVYNNLGEAPRISAFNDPKTLAAWGYNGQVPHLYV
ncbi:MAG: hypothetical protein GY809_09030, partial [Planctomycetes bacterium]|nr:hypothetical protein [Planctomycetota bacterium]